ncbi:MAG: XkdX family protein [Clostridia bacterium]|nr:XkdX family protein [Clostridia bacterium]
MWFDRINRFYELGLWTKEMVAEAVLYKRITSAEYKKITGEKLT